MEQNTGTSFISHHRIKNVPQMNASFSTITPFPSTPPRGCLQIAIILSSSRFAFGHVSKDQGFLSRLMLWGNLLLNGFQNRKPDNKNWKMRMQSFQKRHSSQCWRIVFWVHVTVVPTVSVTMTFTCQHNLILQLDTKLKSECCLWHSYCSIFHNPIPCLLYGIHAHRVCPGHAMSKLVLLCTNTKKETRKTATCASAQLDKTNLNRTTQLPQITFCFKNVLKWGFFLLSSLSLGKTNP